jgi:tRNA (uracil-5-)-methyltransferase
MSASPVASSAAWTPSRVRCTRASPARAWRCPARRLDRRLDRRGRVARASDAADGSASYRDLLDAKVARTRELFGDLLPPEGLEVYASPRTRGFRQRCRFAVVREGASGAGDVSPRVEAPSSVGSGNLRYALFERGRVVVLDARDANAFGAASRAIAELMPRVLDALNDLDKREDASEGSARDPSPLTENLSAVGFLSNRAGDVVVTLWNGTKRGTKRTKRDSDAFDERWETAAIAFRESLEPYGVKGVVSRRRRKTLANGADRVWEETAVPSFSSLMLSKKTKKTDANARDDDRDDDASVDTLRLSMVEGAFSNPNADVAEITAAWLRETAIRALAEREDEDETPTEGKRKKDFSLKKKRKPSLTELYCGNGTHAVNLARAFHAVTAVEIEPRLCAAAEENFAANGVTNARVQATPAETFSARRSASGGDDDDDDDDAETNETETADDFILVDPPRAGLDPVTLSLVRRYRTIVYIACDSRSLVRDLRERKLSQTHELKRAAVFDHFPYSEFCEVVVWAERRREK